MYSFRHWFRNQRVAKSITIALFLAILFAVGFAIYSFFRWDFGLIAQNAYLRVALPLFFYEGLFFVVFLLVFISSFITAIFALFRSGQVNSFVMASPKFSMVFWRAYRQAFFSSAWPIVVITIPAFLGSAAVFPVSLWGGFLFVLSAIFLAGFGTSLAVMLFLLCAYILYILRHYFGRAFFSFGKSVLLGVLFMTAGLVLIWQRVGIGDLASIFVPLDPSWTASRLDVLFARFGMFPSHLVTLALFYAQQGSFGAAAIAVSTLAGMFVLSVLLLYVMASGFLPFWQLFQEGRYEAKTVSADAERPRGAEGPVAFPRYFKSPIGALFEKEGIVLFRGMKSALWFFFLFVLWMALVVLESLVHGDLAGPNLGPTIAVMESIQLATAVYFVSAFILRFAFPAFSGEGRTAWILGSAPLRMRSVFWSKFSFYASLFLILGVVFCGLNFLVIKAAIVQWPAFVAFALLTIIFLVAFGLGLGAIFPNFESDDPEVLSTSLPGLGFIFGSLLYGEREPMSSTGS